MPSPMKCFCGSRRWSRHVSIYAERSDAAPYGCESNHMDVAALLLQREASLEVKDELGWVPVVPHYQAQ